MSKIGTPPAFFAPDTPRDLMTPNPTSRVFVTEDYSRVTYYWDVDRAKWIPVGETAIDIDFFVDPNLGNDSNVGDFANPLATIQEAIDRLPRKIKHRIQIFLIDNGAVTVFDERILLADFDIVGGEFFIIGSTDLATLASGPNEILANPGGGGDRTSITVAPSPGWTPGDLVGRRIEFTSGPHNGDVAFVLANTADTITLSRCEPSATPYGNTDLFEIQDILTVIQNVSGFFNPPTLTVDDIQGHATSFPALGRLRFQDIHIKGDTFTLTSLQIARAWCNFEGCRIDDFVYVNSVDTGRAYLSLEESCFYAEINGSGSPLFSVEDLADFKIVMARSGILGSLTLNGDARGFLDASEAHFLGAPGSPLTYILNIQGGGFQASSVQIDGELVKAPIVLSDYYDGGNPSSLTLNSCRLLRSSESGIAVRMAEGFLVPHVIVIDPSIGAAAPTFIDGNAQYGIDLSGPQRVEIYSEIAGINGLFGLRLKNQAVCAVLGATAPTMSGPLGLGLDDIDFDGRGLIPLNLAWIDETTSGGDTLCLYINQSSPPGPPT